MDLGAESIRSNLKLNNDQQFFIALAVVHDEEKPNFVLTPKFLTIDVSSQTNKDKRDFQLVM